MGIIKLLKLLIKSRNMEAMKPKELKKYCLNNPQYYLSPEGEEFGMITLIEGKSRRVATDPKQFYAEDKPSSIPYKLVFISTTKGKVVGELDFYVAIERLRPYIQNANSQYIDIEPLTLEEMENLVK